MFEEMWAPTRVSTKSLIYNMANQRNQLNVLRPSESFLRQQKRFHVNKVAMYGDERLKAQTLKGQALCFVWENQFQSFEKNGISGESIAHSFPHD